MSLTRITSHSHLLTPFSNRGGLYFPLVWRGTDSEFLFPANLDIASRCIIAPGGQGLTTLARVLSTQKEFIPVCINGFFNPGAPEAGVDTDHESLPLTQAGNDRFTLSEIFAEDSGMSAQEFWRIAFLAALPIPELEGIMGKKRFWRVSRILREKSSFYEKSIKQCQGEGMRLIIDFRAGGINEDEEVLRALVHEISVIETIRRDMSIMLFLERNTFMKLAERYPHIERGITNHLSWSWNELLCLFFQVLHHCDVFHPTPDDEFEPGMTFLRMMENLYDIFYANQKRNATPETWLIQRLKDGKERIRPYDFLVFMQFLLMYSPKGTQGIFDANALIRAEAVACWSPLAFLRQHAWAWQALQVLRNKLVPLSPKGLANVWEKAFITPYSSRSPLTCLQATYIGKDVDTWDGLIEKMLAFGFFKRERDGERLTVPNLYRRCLRIGLRGGCRDK